MEVVGTVEAEWVVGSVAALRVAVVKAVEPSAVTRAVMAERAAMEEVQEGRG